MNKVSGVYQIVNTVTGDSYIGSSKDVKKRWTSHKCPSMWKQHPNSSMYLDMQKYGVENFRFQFLAAETPEHLKQVEQEFIEMFHPTYNDRRSKGLDAEKRKESARKYQKKHDSRLCSYNGETLTLSALYQRFRKSGIEHPTAEAKKYLIEEVK